MLVFRERKSVPLSVAHFSNKKGQRPVFLLYCVLFLFVFHFSVTIRGGKDESAVLCTDSHTFDIKEQETSNGLLLLPKLRLPDDIDMKVEMHVEKQQVGTAPQRQQTLILWIQTTIFCSLHKLQMNSLICYLLLGFELELQIL